MSNYGPVIRIPLEQKDAFERLLKQRYSDDKNALVADALAHLEQKHFPPQIVDRRPIGIPGVTCQVCGQREATTMIFFSNNSFSWRCDECSDQA